MEEGSAVGRGGVGGERGGRSRVKEEKRGRRGKSHSQKRGAVVYIATGNRPSYVHQLTSTSRRWWPRGRPTTAGFVEGWGGTRYAMGPAHDGNNNRMAKELECF